MDVYEILFTISCVRFNNLSHDAQNQNRKNNHQSHFYLNIDFWNEVCRYEKSFSCFKVNVIIFLNTTFKILKVSWIKILTKGNFVL